MEYAKELKKWYKSLDFGEKRNIKILGQSRARNGKSQQLKLFEWLGKAKKEEHIPEKLGLGKGFSSVADRLKELILDSLYHLHKKDSIDMQLHSNLADVALLFKKNLISSANRTLKKTKRLALHTCRYNYALQCLDWERKMIQAKPNGNIFQQLDAIREEERKLIRKLDDFLELKYLHDWLRAKARHILNPRNHEILMEVQAKTNLDIVNKLAETGNYWEKAMAVNILGIHNMFERKPQLALNRYADLLKTWQQNSAWQIDQERLLLQICTYFQIAVFNSNGTAKETQILLRIPHTFQGSTPEAAYYFKKMLYLNQFTLALNIGNWEAVTNLIPEVDAWLTENASMVNEVEKLPFLNNFATAEFILGNFKSAYQYVLRILNMPNKKARMDIREFALVLQAVLQYEMGNRELNEYLSRAGKRYFEKNSREAEFEIAVFSYLEKVSTSDDLNKISKAETNLIADLNRISNITPNAFPILGLNEMLLWAQAKQQKISVKECFSNVIAENLKSLG